MRVKLQTGNMNVLIKCFQLVGSLVQGPVHPFKSLLEGFINLLPQPSYLSLVGFTLLNSRFLLLFKIFHALVSTRIHLCICSGDPFSRLLLYFQRTSKLNNPGYKKRRGSVKFFLLLKRYHLACLIFYLVKFQVLKGIN